MSSSLSLEQEQLKQQWSSLLSATMTSCVHHLLYVRCVYPKESFTRAKCLGIGNCRINRHVQVCNYISRTIKVIVPSLLSGMANQVIMTIYNEHEHCQKQRPATEPAVDFIEQYVFKIQSPPQITSNHIDGKLVLVEMEQAMRDLILRIHGLQARNLQSLVGDGLCFKLGLVANNNSQHEACDELTRAVSQGKWYHHGNYNHLESNERRNRTGILHRPLQQVSVPECGLQMDLTMQVPNQETHASDNARKDLD